MICNNLKRFFCTVKLTIPENMYWMLCYDSYESISLFKISIEENLSNKNRQATHTKRKEFNDIKEKERETNGPQNNNIAF